MLHGEGSRTPMDEVATVLERASTINAPLRVVWERIASHEGINDEMRPWLTMSAPRGVGALQLETVPVGRPLGRAWLRLFGVLPFDYDDLTIVELEPGHRFHEKSTMASMRYWEHERCLVERGGSTEITDRITFVPRWGLSWARPVLARVVSAFFAHRHRRLARYFERAR
jgi:ligand-binding SRPBCC domain-containing protein